MENVFEELDDGELQHFFLKQVSYGGPDGMKTLAENILSSGKDQIYGKVVHLNVQSELFAFLAHSDLIKKGFRMPHFNVIDHHVASFC